MDDVRRDEAWRGRGHAGDGGGGRDRWRRGGRRRLGRRGLGKQQFARIDVVERRLADLEAALDERVELLLGNPRILGGVEPANSVVGVEDQGIANRSRLAGLDRDEAEVFERLHALLPGPLGALADEAGVERHLAGFAQGDEALVEASGPEIEIDHRGGLALGAVIDDRADQRHAAGDGGEAVALLAVPQPFGVEVGPETVAQVELTLRDFLRRFCYDDLHGDAPW